MKHYQKRLIGFLSGIILLTTLAGPVQAQPSPPSNHGSSQNESGGSAPIGDGLLILGVLGLAWAGRKIYQNWEKITD